MNDVVAPGVRERFVAFPCGGDACVGVLSVPADPARGRTIGVLVVVGGPQYRVGSHRQFALLARALAAEGYPVLRFDVRGMGDSDGDARTFEAIGDDVDAAIAVLRAEGRVDRVALWGLCDAATAALMRGTPDAAVCGIVALNPWARAPSTQAQVVLRHYYVRRLLDPSFWRKLVTGKLRVGTSVRDLGANVRSARQSPETDAADFLSRMDRGWAAFPHPILFVLSGQDFTAREFETWVAASAPRTARLSAPRTRVVRFADADHTFSRGEWRDAVARETIRWLRSLEA